MLEILLYISLFFIHSNSRCFSVEKAITEEMPEKVMIIILNKIDLVPRSVLDKVIIGSLSYVIDNCFSFQAIPRDLLDEPFEPIT